ncbi:HamA C-terminal domain-containing protein [Sphingobacterium zeae]|uniref:Anti-bacteriophage protein A/HamA C-terminal domain-containing protein n=1 Tax=Sphingobacterium zeae TaxID=1776859 RepID=A0ABU0U6D1_9SPHI|nr:DUF1837 domain-containing protein [Sphingobacterium zeae]MDQ1150507.1 hypothetical protein [Sphingobacterium zeae]
MNKRFEDAIDRLLISSRGEINSRVSVVQANVSLLDTSTTCHCYCLKVDANNNLRVNDLVDFIDEKILDYAIPKKEIDDAKEYFKCTGSTSKIMRLRKKAEGLFTNLERTGEGGEILLYILVQEFLKIPQLISKMSLKTSGQLHYQGADGIHVKYDNKTSTLNLYWGESKMYSNMNDAMSQCMKSLKSYLLDPLSANSVQERDLQLITANITQNVNDPELENALVRYFDKDDDMSNQIVYKGLCFIGFDISNYPIPGVIKSTETIIEELQKDIENWHKTLINKIKEHDNLKLKEILVFLLPFPSVAEFRKIYLNTIK